MAGERVGTCVLCRQDTTDAFDYYKASALVGVSKEDNLLGTQTTKTTTYRDVVKQTGFICADCRKSARKESRRHGAIFSGIIIAVAGVTAIIAAENDITGLAVIAGLVAGFMVLYYVLALLITRWADNGSALLVEQMKMRDRLHAHLYFTPTEASKMYKTKG